MIFMYNNDMFKRFFCLFIALLICGCATAPEYDSLKAAVKQTFILNEASLKNVRLGMTQDEVHAFMGQSIIVGYSYQNSSDAKPITIPNPYKTEHVKTAKGDCVSEYYVTAVHQPDGVVSDDELMPLTFCGGVLAYKGWDQKK